MYHDYSFKNVLASSLRAAWRIEDVLPSGATLDFGRPFMPDGLARTSNAPGLSDADRLTLNHIRGHEYLSIFGLVEELILPFVLDHARPQLNDDDHRVRALINFAGEEAKHIHLFRNFHACFVRGFGTDCQIIGPPQAIASHILGHDPLAVALLILHVEWMTQRHYIESVRDRQDLDPLFVGLLKHHWMEEAQHARLDTLMVEALVEGRDDAALRSAIDEYLSLCGFFDDGLTTQAAFNLDGLENATGRALPLDVREALLAQQHQALRWTYLGSGMSHPKFAATLAAMSPAARDRVLAAAPAFC